MQEMWWSDADATTSLFTVFNNDITAGNTAYVEIEAVFVTGPSVM